MSDELDNRHADDLEPNVAELTRRIIESTKHSRDGDKEDPISLAKEILNGEFASLRARPQEPDCKHIRYDGRPWLEGFSYSNRPLSAFKTWVPKFCPDCGEKISAPSGPLSDPEGEVK